MVKLNITKDINVDTPVENEIPIVHHYFKQLTRKLKKMKDMAPTFSLEKYRKKLNCQGLNIAYFDLSFKKGYAQLSAYQGDPATTTYRDDDFCEGRI